MQDIEIKEAINDIVKKAVSQDLTKCLEYNNQEILRDLHALTTKVAPDLIHGWFPLAPEYKEDLKKCFKENLPIIVYNSRDNRITKNSQLNAATDLKSWEITVNEKPHEPWNPDFHLLFSVACDLKSLVRYSAGYNQVVLRSRNHTVVQDILYRPTGDFNVIPSNLPSFFKVFSDLFGQFYEQFNNGGVMEIAQKEKRLELIVAILTRKIGSVYKLPDEDSKNTSAEQGLVRSEILSNGKVEIKIGNPHWYGRPIVIENTLDIFEENLDNIGDEIIHILDLATKHGWSISVSGDVHLLCVVEGEKQ